MMGKIKEIRKGCEAKSGTIGGLVGRSPFRIDSMGRKVVFIGVSESLLFILLLELRECASSLRKLGNMVA
jgi:hypothetical protein